MEIGRNRSIALRMVEAFQTNIPLFQEKPPCAR